MIKPTKFDKNVHKTKSDKVAERIVSKPLDGISQDRWEEIFKIDEKERLRLIREHKLRRGEIKKKEVCTPSVSVWNNEWTTLATGRPMSKSELKVYCKQNGKEWTN